MNFIEENIIVGHVKLQTGNPVVVIYHKAYRTEIEPGMYLLPV